MSGPCGYTDAVHKGRGHGLGNRGDRVCGRGVRSGKDAGHVLFEPGPIFRLRIKEESGARLISGGDQARRRTGKA